MAAPESLADAYERQRREVEQANQMEAAEQRKLLANAHVDGLLARAAIPPRFRDRTFEGFHADTLEQRRALHVCRQYAERFADVREKGTCLVLAGEPGTGKTHLAVAILNSIARRGYSGLFASVSEVLRRIRGSFRDGGKGEAEVYREFADVDLLVLDEVGVAIGDDDKRRVMLFDLLNARYNEVKPTVLLGNLTKEQMDAYLGERVADRLAEGGGATVAFTWGSYRRAAR